jgi:hypothetical protein
MTTETPETTNPNPAPVVASSGVAPQAATSLSGVGDAAPPAETNQAPAAPQSTPELAPSLLETVSAELAEETKAKIAAATPSLDAPKPDAAKPEAKPDAKPAEAAKDAAKPAEPAAPAPLPPVEYAYTLPETITFGEGDKDKVHGAFDAFRADPAKGAQALIDLRDTVTRVYSGGGRVGQGLLPGLGLGRRLLDHALEFGDRLDLLGQLVPGGGLGGDRGVQLGLQPGDLGGRLAGLQVVVLLGLLGQLGLELFDGHGHVGAALLISTDSFFTRLG